MAGDLCAVLLQADYLTLDGTTFISVFLSMQYFIYFTHNPMVSSLYDTKHPPYIKIFLLKSGVRGLYTVFTFFYTLCTHLVVINTSLPYILNI